MKKLFWMALINCFSVFCLKTFACGPGSYYNSGFNIRLLDESSLLTSEDSLDLSISGTKNNLLLWQKYLEKKGIDASIDELDDLIYKSKLIDSDSLETDEIRLYRELKNKKEQDVLDYILFAKRLEFHHTYSDDEWGTPNYLLDTVPYRWYQRESFPADPYFDGKYLKYAEKKYKELSNDPELRIRYAYQTITWKRYHNYAGDLEKEYHTYFDKTEHLLKYWALHHVANWVQEYLKGDRHVEYHHEVFLKAPSKRARTIQQLRRYYTGAGVRSNKESLIISKLSFEGPILSFIKPIKLTNSLIESVYFKRLLLKEVNKVQDWMLTDQVTNFTKIFTDNMDKSLSKKIGIDLGRLPYHGDEYKALHRKNNINYTRQFIHYLKNVRYISNSEDKVFYSLLIANCHVALKEYSLAYKEIGSKLSEVNESTVLTYHLNKTALVSSVLANREQNSEDALYDFVNLAYKFRFQLTDYRSDLYDVFMIIANAHHKNKRYEQAAFLYTFAENLGKPITSHYWVNNPEREPDKFMDLVMNGPKTDSSSEFHYEMVAEVDYEVGNEKSYPYFFHYLDHYASSTQVDLFIKQVNKKTRTNLEKLIFGSIKFNNDRLYDLLGTKYFREDNLLMAEKTFSKIGTEYLTTEIQKRYLGRNPFDREAYRLGVRRETHQGSGVLIKTNWTKLTITQELLRLKKEINKHPDKRCINYFKLANAYENFSYQGENWLMYVFWWDENESPNHDDKNGWLTGKFHEDYLGMKKAVSYYKKSYKYAKDDSARVLINYIMLSPRLAQKEYEFAKKLSFGSKKSSYELYVEKDKYRSLTFEKDWKLFKTNYSDYYEDIVWNCYGYDRYMKHL